MRRGGDLDVEAIAFELQPRQRGVGEDGRVDRQRSAVGVDQVELELGADGRGPAAEAGPGQ